jgi:DNA-directed RNA polymerase subunit M/transcription elongation factor TFIIS
MPINYKDYPANWKTEIRPAILKRAKNKCEMCGAPNKTVILRTRDTFEVLENSTSLEALELDGARLTTVVLTVAHMDHDITNSDPANLKALCQKCHLHHDKYQHRQTRESKKSLMIEFN